jgi:hypothetical protein
LGAGYRTRNFIVDAPSAQLAREVGDAAETFRHDLAVEWLEKPLADWAEPCPIYVTNVGEKVGAGGATSFMFDRGRPFGWKMTLQGSRERILDSVLPHEVTHSIFATHFGRPLPRWADEGACTTVEHHSEKKKQEDNLIVFLTTNRGIAFNQMFAMTEYPQDVLPLYSQGYSLARFLIAQGGKPKFVEYVGEGMKTKNWTATTKTYYGFENLSDLQVTWVEWVRSGSQEAKAEETLAAREGKSNVKAAVTQLASTKAPEADWREVRNEDAKSVAKTAPIEALAKNDDRPQGGWYARKRDESRTKLVPRNGGKAIALGDKPLDTTNHEMVQTARPQPLATPQQQVIEWTRPPQASVPQTKWR